MISLCKLLLDKLEKILAKYGMRVKQKGGFGINKVFISLIYSEHDESVNYLFEYCIVCDIVFQGAYEIFVNLESGFSILLDFIYRIQKIVVIELL